MTVIDLSPSLPVSQQHTNVQGLVSLLLLDESPGTVIHCPNLKKNSSFTISASGPFRPEAFHRDKTSESGWEKGVNEGGCPATEGRRGLRNWDGVRTKATMGNRGVDVLSESTRTQKAEETKGF